MRRGAFAVTLLGLMLLAGCFGPSTASWGGDGVTVDFDQASTSFTSNLGPEEVRMDGLQAVGCSPGDEDPATNKTIPIKFTGYLAASQMYSSHADPANNITNGVTASVAIQAMQFGQAADLLEGEGARVDLKDWNDPLNPVTGAGTVDLDEIDSDEDTRWYILGLIPTSEPVHDGMLSLGEWHQPVTIEGYLVASDASNAYGYHQSQTVSPDCSLDISSQNREQLFVMVTGIKLEDASVSSSGNAEDEWVHGDVPILGRTGFMLMFFTVGIGGAVGAFILSKMFVMKGARNTMRTLLGQVGMDNIKKVKQDVKKAKSSGMSSPSSRKAEQRSTAKKELPKSAKPSKDSGLSGFDMDSILSNDEGASPVVSSSIGSSVVVTTEAKDMEQSVTQSSNVASASSGTVWTPSPRTSSAPTSVVSHSQEPEPQEHFSSTAPTRSSPAQPKQPPKKKAVRKRKTSPVAQPEPDVAEEPSPRAEKETYQEDEDFSDFSF
jgi:hypothetical protein